MEDVVIQVKDLVKYFKIYYDKGSQLKERILFRKRNKYENRKVLDGISFDIYKGEAVGLIGHNGCGKSTTLKLLTKIIYPDAGTIKIDGRISSLIELGAGFHPDMSGRENIYINASIFGLTKKEIDRRLDDIIAFSELEKYIDNPVRTYSSGMYMRLAFSVAINVDADILLIDEILAVGDSNFQAKCFEKLREIKAQGTTIVIVTHDTGTIEKFCDRAIWLNDGKIVDIGKSTLVVDKYLQYMNGKKIESLMKEEERLKKKREKEEQEAKEKAEQKAKEEQRLKEEQKLKEEQEKKNANHFGLDTNAITEAYLLDDQKNKTTVLEGGKSAEIVIHYKLSKELNELVFGMGFFDMDGRCIFGNNTQLDRVEIDKEKLEGVIHFHMPEVPLLTGRYGLNVSIVDYDGTPIDYYRVYKYFDVVSANRSVGYCTVNHSWEME